MTSFLDNQKIKPFLKTIFGLKKSQFLNICAKNTIFWLKYAGNGLKVVRKLKKLIWWQVWCSSIRVDQFRTIKGYKCLFFPLGWAAAAAHQPEPSLGRQNPQFIHYAKYAMPPSAKANIIISSSAWKKSIRQETNAHFQWDFLLRASVKKRTAKVSCFQLIQNFYFLKDIWKKYFNHNYVPY